MGINYDTKMGWRGNSSLNYEFWIFDLDQDFGEEEIGNFIFAKQVDLHWDAIFIGEGKLKEQIGQLIADGCVIEKGSTHIHANINEDQAIRKRTVSDLLAKHLEAFDPTGCNKQAGW